MRINTIIYTFVLFKVICIRAKGGDMKYKFETSKELLQVYSMLVKAHLFPDTYNITPTTTGLSKSMKKSISVISDQLKSLLELGLAKKTRKGKEVIYIPVHKKFLNIVAREIFGVIDEYGSDMVTPGVKYDSGKVRRAVKTIIYDNRTLLTGYITGKLFDQQYLDYYLNELIENFLLLMLFIDYKYKFSKKDKNFKNLLILAESYNISISDVPIANIKNLGWKRFDMLNLDKQIKHLMKLSD